METDTGQMKVGDGVRRWNALPYVGTGVTGPTGPTGIVGPTGTVLGNVARVDKVYGNDATADIGGLPFLTIEAAIAKIIGPTGTVASPQYSNKTIWVMPGVYDISPTGTNATITTNIGETLYPLLQLPSTTCLRGINLQTCVIQCSNPTQNTALFNVGSNTRIEDLNITIGGSGYTGSNNLVGLYFGSTASISSKIRVSTINVCNANMPYTSSNNLYGVQFDGTGGSYTTFFFNCIKGCTIAVYGNGSGNKRGMIVTNSNIATLRDTNIYVAAPPTNSNFAGSYVGMEARDANNLGSVQCRSTTVGSVKATGAQTYTSSDILQTNPATIADPTYLASPGIQVGPGTDLVTKSAGGKGFTTYIYPTTIYYGCRGTITNTTAGWLWPGTQFFTNSTPKYPDDTIPVARYRVQQPLIVSGLTVFCALGPGAGHTTVITVCKNSTGATTGTYPVAPNGATSIAVTLSGTPLVGTYYNTSVDFAPGDYLSVHFQTDSPHIHDVGIQVDCF